MSETVHDLRRAFDAAFGEPPRADARAEVALLTLRAGAERVAVRALETGGILAAGRIQPVPSGRPELLGLAGVRGGVVPVYALERLLGASPATEAPRWFLLAGAERLALAFTAFEAHLRVAASAVELATGAPADAVVRELVRLEGRTLPVLSVPALLKSILIVP